MFIEFRHAETRRFDRAVAEKLNSDRVIRFESTLNGGHLREEMETLNDADRQLQQTIDMTSALNNVWSTRRKMTI